MENIKVGDYAKHIKDGYIGKIVSFDNIFVHLDIGRSALRHYIKTAENIIDLIQSGDYVNGEKVCMVSEYKGEKMVDVDRVMYVNKNIKSIVTKEAFSQMEYVVGE